MNTYTVAVREKGATRPFRYIEFDGDNVHLNDTTNRSRPLTRCEAEEAKRLLIDGAAAQGRPIECQIVRLARGEG